MSTRKARKLISLRHARMSEASSRRHGVTLPERSSVLLYGGATRVKIDEASDPAIRSRCKSQRDNRGKTVNDTRRWSRIHRNGMVALVFQSEPERFSAGAVPANGTASIHTDVRGSLERAKTYADEQSGCPQPCTCPRWQDRIDSDV